MKKAIITINLFCTLLLANNFDKLHQDKEHLPEASEFAKLQQSTEKTEQEALEDFIFACAPKDIQFIVDELLNHNNYKEDPPKKVLFVGPSGTGKTALAKIIANKIDAKLEFVSAHTLLNEYKNSGPQNIERLFDKITQSGQRCVVVIDEVDCLFRGHNSKHDPDPRTAEALWSALDRISKDKNIFFIGTLNNNKEIPTPLKDRFAHNIVKFELPDKTLRREILEFYLKKIKHSCDSGCLDHLVKNSSDKSSRILEDLICEGSRQARRRDPQDRSAELQDFKEVMAKWESKGYGEKIGEIIDSENFDRASKGLGILATASAVLGFCVFVAKTAKDLSEGKVPELPNTTGTANVSTGK